MNELEIIYRDNYSIAINKPSGLLVHRTPIASNVNEFALQLLRDQIGQRVYPIHRIDRATSGVLLFGMTGPDARMLCDIFENREVTKEYLAVVRGYTDEEGHIDHPLKKDKTKEPVGAETAYERLETLEINVPVGKYACGRYSLVKARPITGRMHQIRRHFRHISHPVIGDTTYGDTQHNRLFAEEFDNTRMLLHAQKLTFSHPVTEQSVSIEAALDTVMTRIVTLFH